MPRSRNKLTWRRKVARKFGNKPGATNCKVYTLPKDVGNFGMVPHNQCTLYGYELTNIQKGTERYQRESGVLNLRGIRIDLSLLNISKNNAGGGIAGDVPIFCNFAIVQPKALGDYSVAANMSGDWRKEYPVEMTEDFFRFNGGATRGYGFLVPTAPPVYELFDGKDYGKAPLNPEEFHILWHWRCTLGTEGGSQYRTDQPRYRNKIKYIPIKRQIRYENQNTNTSADARIYFIYWFSGIDLRKGVFGGTGGNPVDASTIEACSVRQKAYVYFREPLASH